MKRQDKPGREAKKKPKEVQRVTKQEPVQKKTWKLVPGEELKPRACRYRGYPNHHLIVCMDCLGFPEE